MNNLSNLLSSVKSESPTLFWIVIIHFIGALACLPALYIDERTLLGVNVWIKPLKFCISTGIYILTVGYLMNIYPYSKKKRNIIKGIVSWTLFIETLIIIYQASRGVQSHYNMSTGIDALLYMSMGILTGLNVLFMLLFIVDTIRLKLNTSKSIQWSILLGWLVVFFGCWIGGQMIAQLSHNVGVADGGAGLPLVNWSTKGGDLRIAHFFGLHGIQIIPLFAVWISNNLKTTKAKLLMAITLFGLTYASWIGFTFWQAKQGIPLLPI